MYGAGQHHIPDGCLASLRCANFKAIWRTLFRASPEIVFTALTATWRADVMAVAVTAPWWFLRGAVIRGMMDVPTVVSLLWQSNRETVGPIAAALAGLRRVGVSSP